MAPSGWTDGAGDGTDSRCAHREPEWWPAEFAALQRGGGGGGFGLDALWAALFEFCALVMEQPCLEDAPPHLLDLYVVTGATHADRAERLFRVVGAILGAGWCGGHGAEGRIGASGDPDADEVPSLSAVQVAVVPLQRALEPCRSMPHRRAMHRLRQVRLDYFVMRTYRLAPRDVGEWVARLAPHQVEFAILTCRMWPRSTPCCRAS